MPTTRKTIIYWIILYGYISVVWKYYHFATRFPGWVDEVVFKPFIELVPVLFVVFVMEKANWKSLGFVKKYFWNYISLGFIVGIGLILVRFIVKNLTGAAVEINPQNMSIDGFLLFGITASAVGFLEETIFRGYFFQRLWWFSHNELLANITTSFMFAFAHLPVEIFFRPIIFQDVFFYTMQVIVMGVVFGFLFARTKSIIPSIAAHAIWKFSNVIFV